VTTIENEADIDGLLCSKNEGIILRQGIRIVIEAENMVKADNYRKCVIVGRDFWSTTYYKRYAGK